MIFPMQLLSLATLSLHLVHMIFIEMIYRFILDCHQNW